MNKEAQRPLDLKDPPAADGDPEEPGGAVDQPARARTPRGEEVATGDPRPCVSREAGHPREERE